MLPLEVNLQRHQATVTIQLTFPSEKVANAAEGELWGFDFRQLFSK
jgi:hypothetical protein